MKHVLRTASFDRPANTTQYTAGDGVSDDATTPTAMTFAKVVTTDSIGGRIRSVVLHKTDQDLTSADFVLYLFDTAPAAVGFDDNGAIAITDAEWQACLGGIALAASDGKSVVTGDIWSKTNLDLAFQCASGSRDIYGVLVADGTYTPASGETFTVRLGVESD